MKKDATLSGEWNAIEVTLSVSTWLLLASPFSSPTAQKFQLKFMQLVIITVLLPFDKYLLLFSERYIIAYGFFRNCCWAEPSRAKAWWYAVLKS